MCDNLWNGKEVIGIISGHGFTEWVATGVSIDTRTLNKGDIFFALPGPSNDGNDFIEEALKKGASCAITNRPSLINYKKVIFVNDVYKALVKLAKYSRQRSQAKIIAVTGSSGKTTLKEMISHFLSHCGKTHKSEKSYNNFIGVPLSLVRMPKDSKYAVYEIGMNKKGEISKLANLVKPHIGIVNNVGEAHLGNFLSREDLIKEKLSIIDGITNFGNLIINEKLKINLDYKAIKNKNLNISTFGNSKKSDISLRKSFQMNQENVLKIKIGKEFFNYSISLTGEHMALNTLPALLTCILTNNSREKFVEKIKTFENIEGRGNKIKTNFIGKPLTIINECYNANPSSMAAAIKSFDEISFIPNSRKVFFVGDMLELGKYSQEYHKKIGKILNNSSINIIYAVGNEIKHIWTEICYEKQGKIYTGINKLIPDLKSIFRENDIILLKGSSKVNLIQIIEEINKNKILRKIA